MRSLLTNEKVIIPKTPFAGQVPGLIIPTHINYESPAANFCSSPPHPNNEQQRCHLGIDYKNLDTFWICTAGNVCFQSKFTFTAAKEVTGEEKHSQYISAINSIHSCPAVCAWRTQSASFWGFLHWKLILHIQRRKLFVTCQECAQDHTELKRQNEIQIQFSWSLSVLFHSFKNSKTPQSQREEIHFKKSHFWVLPFQKRGKSVNDIRFGNKNRHTDLSA